jgi:hypothetical protein
MADNASPLTGFFNGMDVSTPTWVNYGRVAIDILLIVLLVTVVATDVRVNSVEPDMSIHAHEVPVYIKRALDYSQMFNTAASDDKLSDREILSKFQVPAAAACKGAVEHPMCVCIRNATETIGAKNCLLQNPMPSKYMDWNIGAVSASMALWFLASLATSVGTLPFINSYVSKSNKVEAGGVGKPDVIVSWHRIIVVLYVILTLLAVFVPMVIISIQFPHSAAHMGAYANILMWSGLAMLSLGLYNHKTIIGYLGWMRMDQHEKSVAHQKVMSVHNWILYVHLLVSAPAIAMIIHINQSWTEYHMIVNTTLLISTIFAVDGFSAEMANYWSSQARDADLQIDDLRSTTLRFRDTSATEKQTKESRLKEVNDMHMRLGLVRLFAWVVNSVMLLLLFSIAYPLEIDHKKTNSALFVVLVVLFGAVFLAPDLVREFTQRVSFNNIQFRLYGDFVMRCLVLFFVWRGSIMERK